MLRRHQQILVFRWCVWCCCRQSRNNDTAAGLISDYSKSLISPQFVTASDACGFWASTWIAHNLCSVLAAVYLRVSVNTKCSCPRLKLQVQCRRLVSWSVNFVLNYNIYFSQCEVWWRLPHQHSMVAQNQKKAGDVGLFFSNGAPHTRVHTFHMKPLKHDKQWTCKTHLCSDIKLSAS